MTPSAAVGGAPHRLRPALNVLYRVVPSATIRLARLSAAERRAASAAWSSVSRL